MSTKWAFYNIENKKTIYRGDDCKKNFCTLREHTTNVTNFEKKKILLLTKKS